MGGAVGTAIRRPQKVLVSSSVAAPPSGGPAPSSARAAAERTSSERSKGSSGSSAQVPPDACARRFEVPKADASLVSALTWNVAAVNNNPFEYWIHFEDRGYTELMQGVEEFLDNPAPEQDVEVGSVFTDRMFQELVQLMREEGMPGVDEVEEKFWRGGDLRLAHRRVVSEFIKDTTLGSKRLISMPDRVTNTINVVTRSEGEPRPPPVCRPTVINNYEGDLSTSDLWWEQWKQFMFRCSVTVRTAVGARVQRPVQMLEPIPRSKYPAITQDEERLAMPLQLICQAVFDAIIVHLMNRLSPGSSWQIVKSKICDSLYLRKHERTMEILAETYGVVDVMCLQEVAAVFKDRFQESPLSATHELITPLKLDGKRDQNSMVILRKGFFEPASVKEVTASISSALQGEMQLADGDLVAVEARCACTGRLYLVVSFHGDTNGLLTVPVTAAVHKVATEKYHGHVLILGLDANVYQEAKVGRQGFHAFVEEYEAMGFTSCFGATPNPAHCRTTCSARTSLQPQLNKAVRYSDRIAKSDMNPKDIILFHKDQLEVLCGDAMRSTSQKNPVKDNTGRLTYNEDCIFPTLEFPSDHGIVAVVVQHVL